MKPWTRRNARAFAPMMLPAFLLALAATAGAQDEGGRAAREREALRRTQAALRQAQEQQASLARENAELAAQAGKLGETAKRAESQLTGSRSEATRLRAELAGVMAERDALRAQAEADTKTARHRAEESTQRIAAASRLAEERSRTVGGMTALLETATRSLANAEKANREMHAFGLQIIDRLRGRATSSTIDPVLGLQQVRLENEAEALRDRLDALRLPQQAR